MEVIAPEEQYFLPQNVASNQETIPLQNILNRKSNHGETGIVTDSYQASQGQSCLGSRKRKIIFMMSLLGGISLIIVIGYIFGLKNSATSELHSSNKSEITGNLQLDRIGSLDRSSILMVVLFI